MIGPNATTVLGFSPVRLDERAASPGGRGGINTWSLNQQSCRLILCFLFLLPCKVLLVGLGPSLGPPGAWCLGFPFLRRVSLKTLYHPPPPSPSLSIIRSKVGFFSSCKPSWLAAGRWSDYLIGFHFSHSLHFRPDSGDQIMGLGGRAGNHGRKKTRTRPGSCIIGRRSKSQTSGLRFTAFRSERMIFGRRRFSCFSFPSLQDRNLATLIERVYVRISVPTPKGPLKFVLEDQ